jgi:hypothetical protein
MQVTGACMQYSAALNRLAVLRLLAQLPCVYSVMRLDKFLALTPKAALDHSLIKLESLLVAALHNNEVGFVSPRACLTISD